MKGNPFDILYGGISWAQVGYGFYRLNGTTEILKYYYAEIYGDTSMPGPVQQDIDIIDPPMENFDYNYKCSLDVSTGLWHFYMDMQEIFIFRFNSDTTWRHAEGETATWTAEVYNREDDMVGTFSNRCNISNCRIAELGHQFRSLTLNDNLILFSNDFYEWQILPIDPDGLQIWDINPQP